MINQIILKRNQPHYQEGKVFGGNQYIFKKLEKNLQKAIDIQN